MVLKVNSALIFGNVSQVQVLHISTETNTTVITQLYSGGDSEQYLLVNTVLAATQKTPAIHTYSTLFNISGSISCESATQMDNSSPWPKPKSYSDENSLHSCWITTRRT